MNVSTTLAFVGSALYASGLSGCDVMQRPDDVKKIKFLLFGRRQGSADLPPSWHQGLFFTNTSRLRYGLVQKQGGPCGVLAAIQAYVLRHLIQRCPHNLDKGDPTEMQRKDALADAMTTILWQAAARNPTRRAAVVTSETKQTTTLVGLSIGHCMRREHRVR